MPEKPNPERGPFTFPNGRRFGCAVPTPKATVLIDESAVMPQRHDCGAYYVPGQPHICEDVTLENERGRTR